LALEIGPLEERINNISKFRKRHEELRAVISKILPASSSAATEIDAAYAQFTNIELLHLSTDGEEIWQAAVKVYDARVDRVESQITARLRDQLATAKNANEMFRIFEHYNGLFFRPRV
jgi:dynein heavy chain 1, cytosolic